MQRPNLKIGGGDFTPYVKYNAKAGRWYTKQEHEGSQEEEVPNMTAVMDIENMKTGYMKFAAGVAPEKVYDDVPGVPGTQPNDPLEGTTDAKGNVRKNAWKHGIELNFFSERNLYGVREFSTTANNVLEAFLDLWDKWDAAPEKAQGQLPVVQCASNTPVTGKHGTNYKPQFTIVAWVDRSDTPLGSGPGAPAPAQVAPETAAPAAQTAPPVPQTAQGSPEF